MAGQVNAINSGDKANISHYVNTNNADYLPKEAVPKARLLAIFDFNGNNIIDNDEKDGLRKVLESNGRESYEIRREDGSLAGYVMDGSRMDAEVSDTYEAAWVNKDGYRDYYTRVNIYTGEEVFIKYHHDEKGDWEERYHNKTLEGRVDAEYTGPNNNLPKRITEVKAIHKQTDEFVLDENGEIVFDDETGEPKRKEELVGYQTVITEYEYDKDFNLIGVPKETRKTSLIQNEPKKTLNIKG